MSRFKAIVLPVRDVPFDDGGLTLGTNAYDDRMRAALREVKLAEQLALETQFPRVLRSTNEPEIDDALWASNEAWEQDEVEVIAE